MDGGDKRPGGLKPSFTPLGIWAFSIGTSIGWGSFIVTCNTYLVKSGVLGTVLGLLIGLAVILVITWNLQHMIRSNPDAGGVYAFQRKVGGKDLGFLAFWFILLTYLAILWANITSVPLFARFFMGDAFQFGFSYHIFGYEVWLGEALLSICAVVLIGLLCARSSRLPGRIVTVAALVFTAAFAVCAVIAMARHGGFSYEPMYTEGASAFGQIVRIAAISPWAFIGFENISHFSEEYTFPVKKVRGILIWSVLITTVLYLFVSMLSVSAYPPEYDSWLAYIQDMGNLEGIKAVPAFYAANYYLGQAGVAVLMLALFAVILTSLIGNMLALSRLLFAAGREGEAPRAFSSLNERGIPQKAIVAIVAVSVLIPFLGRTAIGWIVDVTTLGATIIYWLISHGVYRCAREKGQRLEQCTGLAGMVLMVCFLLLLLVPGLLPFHAMETVSYVLFIAWALLGLAYFRVLVRRDSNREYGQSVVVWVILLMLVSFASMMWVSRATETAANDAVERIYEYHQSHPGQDSGEAAEAERESYLHEQAEQISSTNVLYTAVSLGLFLLFIAMMLNNYRDNQRLGRRLSAAEKEAEAARKIAELTESVRSLLYNMPAMSFSKDAETGVYLACNQAFADYAHKETPAGVAGLTDFEIFDEATAAHFVTDDKKALSMDEPHIFFEDVADAAGNPRQFQTTKLKFYDTSGRLCLLGMSVDVTEMERIRKEREQAEAAYQEALSSGAIYERIVDALSEDYFNLFYVDLKTDDFIEYGLRTEAGHRAEEHRGTDFFNTSQESARTYLYEEDQARFIEALHKERMLAEIEEHGTFIMQYRLMIDGAPTFVNLKATRIGGDEGHLIIGVNNIDAQVKDRATAQRAREERKSYLRFSALYGNLIVLYYVDPEDGEYTEYSSARSYDDLGIAKHGSDFFGATYENSLRTVHPEDQDLFHSQVTRDNIMRSIGRDGVFVLDYRLLKGDLPTYVRLKAAQIQEDGKALLVVGILDEDAQIRREQEYEHDLNVARDMANRDELTGVKNKHAYVDAEKQLNEQIEEQGEIEFAIVVCDVNDLKTVNDTQGHRAGDRIIREACTTICNTFKRSPVYRVGGDEFAVICQGYDYEHAEELMDLLDAANAKSREVGGVQIAFGMARFEEGRSVEAVFEHADERMYGYKAFMKASFSDAGGA